MLRKNIGISLLADFAFPNDEEKLVKIPLSKGDESSSGPRLSCQPKINDFY